jgi:hypothetical protein
VRKGERGREAKNLPSPSPSPPLHSSKSTAQAVYSTTTTTISRFLKQISVSHSSRPTPIPPSFPILSFVLCVPLMHRLDLRFFRFAGGVWLRTHCMSRACLSAPLQAVLGIRRGPSLFLPRWAGGAAARPPLHSFISWGDFNLNRKGKRKGSKKSVFS